MQACRLDRQHGQIPRARAAFAPDALASVVGAVVGTSTVTAFAESVTGVEAGGRTGLVGIVVAMLFVLSLLFEPLIAGVPIQATARFGPGGRPDDGGAMRD